MRARAHTWYLELPTQTCLNEESERQEKGPSMSTASDRAASKWDVVNTQGYNPNGFYTQASDKKGHSAKFTVKVPVNVAGEIANVYQSGKIPEIRNVQDFIRDAIIHRLHQLQSTLDDPDLERKIGMWTIANEALRARHAREEYAEMVVAIDEQVQHLTVTRQTDKLRAYLTDLIDKTDIAIPVEFRQEFTERISLQLKTIGR